jgi:hypothetical protein
MGDLHAIATNGDTALHSAARNGQVFVAALLLLGGLEAQCLNAEGKTPLQLAQEYQHPVTAQVGCKFEEFCQPTPLDYGSLDHCLQPGTAPKSV